MQGISILPRTLREQCSVLYQLLLGVDIYTYIYVYSWSILMPYFSVKTNIFLLTTYRHQLADQVSLFHLAKLSQDHQRKPTTQQKEFKNVVYAKKL